MVAKCTKAERKTAFGLKCRSPKEKEKTCRIRENWSLMCDFGSEASPKDRVIGNGSDTIIEHEFHA